MPADGALRDAALREAPGHSVFCYCAGTAGELDIAAEIKRVRSQLPDDGMALGLRGPQLTTMDTTAADVALARELGLRVSVHVHGAADWPSGRRPIDDCPSAGGDMFATMRTAFAVQRGLDGGLTAWTPGQAASPSARTQT